MISEEEIHRYHITERVYGHPLPILDNTYSHHGEVEGETSSKNKEKNNSERARIVLSITPPSSPIPPEAVKRSNNNQSGEENASVEGGETSKVTKKRKSTIGFSAGNEENINTAKEKRFKKDKTKKSQMDVNGKENVEGMVKENGRDGKKDKGKGKERATVALADTGIISFNPTDLDPASKTGEKKRKKESKSKSEISNAEAESSTSTSASTPKSKAIPKKQKKSKLNNTLRPHISPSTSTTIPISDPTPGMKMTDTDELDSDEADIFEIDELLPSSPVYPSHPLPPISSSRIQHQNTSQPTPTLTPTPTSKARSKKKSKRISDSSGFDIPSAPDHLRHPISHSNSITGNGNGEGGSTPSRLARIGGTPIKKALVRLGASWVTSTPVPK